MRDPDVASLIRATITNCRHARPSAGHPRLLSKQDVDGRDKPGHDELRMISNSKRA